MVNARGGIGMREPAPGSDERSGGMANPAPPSFPVFKNLKKGRGLSVCGVLSVVLSRSVPIDAFAGEGGGRVATDG